MRRVIIYKGYALYKGLWFYPISSCPVPVSTWPLSWPSLTACWDHCDLQALISPSQCITDLILLTKNSHLCLFQRFESSLVLYWVWHQITTEFVLCISSYWVTTRTGAHLLTWRSLVLLILSFRWLFLHQVMKTFVPFCKNSLEWPDQTEWILQVAKDETHHRLFGRHKIAVWC